jgi:hypothetical protein
MALFYTETITRVSFIFHLSERNLCANLGIQQKPSNNETRIY